MGIKLRQSTASQEVPLGPFVDDADGDTQMTALTIANTDIKVWKTGATTLANKNSGGATHISGGIYYAVLDATDTDTVGPLVIFIHVSDALPVRLECEVLEEAMYDYHFGTAVPLSPTTAGRTLDVSAGGEAGVDWANVGSPTTSINLSGTTVKTATDVETDTADIQTRLPAALTAGGNIKADSLAVSGDTAAADNIERWFDGAESLGFSTSGYKFMLYHTTDVAFTVLSDGNHAATFVGASIAGNGSGLVLTGNGSGVSLLANTGVTITGALAMTTLTTSGTTTLNALTVTNTATLGALTVSGATSLATVSSSGTVTLNAFTITNNLTVSGSLNVAGTTALAAVTTSGTVTFNAFSTNGVFNIGSHMTVGGNLTVSGTNAVPWNSSWDAEVESEVQDAIEVNNLDHLLKVAAVAGDVTNSSIIARLTSKSATPAFTSFTNTTDSLEAISDAGGGGGGGSGPSAEEIAEVLVTLLTDAGIQTISAVSETDVYEIEVIQGTTHSSTVSPILLTFSGLGFDLTGTAVFKVEGLGTVGSVTVSSVTTLRLDLTAAQSAALAEGTRTCEFDVTLSGGEVATPGGRGKFTVIPQLS